MEKIKPNKEWDAFMKKLGVKPINVKKLFKGEKRVIGVFHSKKGITNGS